MSAVFRRAEPGDLPRLLELMAALYAEDGSIPLRGDLAEPAMRELLARPELGQLWVIESAGSVDGYLALTWGFSLEYHGPDAFVDEVYLVPEARGRGLGRQALEVAAAACRDRGVHALHLEVERANLRAEALYRRSGFVDNDRRLMTRRLVAVER